MCGLIGFIPKKGESIDLDKLLLLSIGAEERGTEGYGISVYNTYYNRDIKKARESLIPWLEEIRELDLTDKPVIAHTRKSSFPAKITIPCTHPFIIDTQESTFVGAHNGLVTDTYSLFTKYIKTHEQNSHLNFTDIPVDSLFILTALAMSDDSGKKKILADYEGKAALLFHDDKKFYAWKGANNDVEERPLFCVDTKEGYYFYSMTHNDWLHPLRRFAPCLSTLL
jgi:predicted glutamine amidotransferase